MRQAVNEAMGYAGFCYLCERMKPAPKTQSRRRYNADAVDERRRNRSKRAGGVSRFGKMK